VLAVAVGRPVVVGAAVGRPVVVDAVGAEVEGMPSGTARA